MFRILPALLVILPLAAALPARAAEGSCPHKETILTLSEVVLAGRSGLPTLIARRYGAEAAYLKIRYAPLPQEQTRSLLQDLLASGVRPADDLAFAWTIHTDGYDAAVATLGEKQFDLLLSSFGTSTIRAVLLSEGGAETLMKRLTPDAVGKSGGLVATISTAVIDQPDDIKEKIARAAEAHGLPLIAAHVVATEKETAAWAAFLARRSGKDDPLALNQFAYWVPALVGNPALPRPKAEKPEYDTAREKLHRVMMTAAFEPERDFLNTFLNQTGKVDAVHTVAEKLLAQIESGAIKRSGTLDAAWLMAYRGLLAATGDPAQVNSVLETITFAGSRYIQPSTLRDVIDRLLVVEALQPYVTGTTSAMPAPPPELSGTMKADWANWTGMATIVRGGNVSPGLAADPASFGILTELIFAKGEHAALATFVAQAPTGQPRVSAANDFAMRLDRQCASYLSHPAEALLLSGQPIFKFDTP